MPRNPNKLKPGQVALTCDECSKPITGDNGYLVVQNRRWRLFHSECKSIAEIENAAASGGVAENAKQPIVVRSSRVSTYSLLLTTLATLASDTRIDFANTAWPALLKRIAFDTEWCATDGHKRGGELGREHAEKIKAAGFTQKLTRAEPIGESVP
jgi:hypothetical protein